MFQTLFCTVLPKLVEFAANVKRGVRNVAADMKDALNVQLCQRSIVIFFCQFQDSEKGILLKTGTRPARAGKMFSPVRILKT